jgi:Tetratricopeptide repeat
MKLDKENFMAPYNLGILEESEGRVSVAISAYEKSVDRNRGFPPARFRLGRLLEKRGKTHEAIAQYSRALEIDPEMREVRRNPLVADTRLLDRVSVAIYHKDVARVAIKTDTAFADESFRRVPVDRPIYASDLVDPPEPEPVDSTRAPATRAPVGIPPGVRQTRPQDLGTSPAAPPPPPPVPVQPPPPPVPVQPPPVPADPSDALGLRPRPPLPTPLPQ